MGVPETGPYNNDFDRDIEASRMDTDANMRQDQTDTLAERIVAVVRERMKVGDRRRKRALEAQLRNHQRPASRYHLARPPHFVRLANVLPELREQGDRRMQPVDAAYEAVASSNAACRVFESEAANLPSNS